MSYQALYRKYRPKNFDEVVGQNVTVKILKNSIINDKISHAYLFYGPRGTGKTSTAKIFARAVNCTKSKNGIQCEKCDCCLESKEKECIDIIEIDAASNNGVDEIRNLRSNVTFVPTQLRYKVYIIDEVHMLSAGAFNALLKTLEEPPEYVIFILATTELNKVPSTIISRCQLLEFKKLTDNQIAERLKYISNEEKIKIDDDAINEIAIHCDGGLRDSIGLLEKVSSYQSETIQKDDVRTVMGNISETEINKFKESFYNKDITTLISLVNEYYEMGIDLTKVIYDLINLLTKELFEKNINNNSAIMQLDSILTNMIASDNPKLILEVSLLNILSEKDQNLQVNTNTNGSDISSKNVSVKQKQEDNPTGASKEIINNDVNENANKNKDFDIDNIKNIRVGNTLSRAKKDIISNIRTNWKNISDLAFDSTYGNLARLLESDIIPVAASDEYVILNSKMAGLSEQINNDLNSVEKIFDIIFNNKYKVICITEDEWKNYILEYKKDKSSFVYKEETEKKGKKTLKEKAKELFDD